MKDILIKKIIVFLLIWGIFPSTARAISLKHHFSTTVGIFDAARADFEYDLSGGNYSVKSNIYTNGLFDTLYPFKAHYATTGLVKKHSMQTQTYSYQSQSRFSKRTKNVIYDNKGIPQKIVSTKNGKEKIKSIKNYSNIDDTTDLQTVVAKIAKQYTEQHHCNATMKVFDGKRRFNVIFKDLGQENIEQNQNSPYYGKAVKCSMYIDRLKEEGDDMLWKMTSDSPVYFWIMQDEKTQAPFIAKVYVEDTPLGEMIVYTTKTEVKK